HTLTQWALDRFVNNFPTDVDQLAILNPRRAGGLAIAAGKAAVEVALRGGCRRCALKHLFDQIDASAGTVAFVTQHLICGARCQAETTVNTATQDFIGLFADLGVTRPDRKS